MSFKYILLLVLVVFECCSALPLNGDKEEDKYLDLFRIKSKTAAPATGTTYNWGQWTSTALPGSRTTYNWGQHTGSGGSTYDWGQHTATGDSRTTYDWGQHTGSGASRTTYDWGQWTSTSAPGVSTTGSDDGNSTPGPTENPNDQNQYRCSAGKYTCKGTIGLCIDLSQICDGKQDCPHRDDEDKRRCFPGFGGNKNKKKNYNSFAGTGFMFHIRNIDISDGSDVKLFNQQSDNLNGKLTNVNSNQN